MIELLSVDHQYPHKLQRAGFGGTVADLLCKRIAARKKIAGTFVRTKPFIYGSQRFQYSLFRKTVAHFFDQIDCRSCGVYSAGILRGSQINAGKIRECVDLPAYIMYLEKNLIRSFMRTKTLFISCQPIIREPHASHCPRNTLARPRPLEGYPRLLEFIQRK